MYVKSFLRVSSTVVCCDAVLTLLCCKCYVFALRHLAKGFSFVVYGIQCMFFSALHLVQYGAYKKRAKNDAKKIFAGKTPLCAL